MYILLVLESHIHTNSPSTMATGTVVIPIANVNFKGAAKDARASGREPALEEANYKFAK